MLITKSLVFDVPALGVIERKGNLDRAYFRPLAFLRLVEHALYWGDQLSVRVDI